MSRYSNLKLVPGGKVLVDIWDSETRTTDKEVDVTDRLQFFMDLECEIGEGTTFKDVLMAVAQHTGLYNAWSPLFTRGPWMAEMVEEGLNTPSEEETAVEKIKICWQASLSDNFYQKGKSEFQIWTHIYGTIDGEDETYALDFTPLNNLANCQIELESDFMIFDERKESLVGRREYLDSIPEEDKSKEDKYYYPVIANTTRDFTLYDILRGLFWELSFHGSPKDRTKRREELMEQIERIDRGEEKLIPMEDVMKDLKGLLEDDTE